MNEEILQEFITESLESLEAIEPLVATLDPEADNSSSLHAVFRMMHSIKGTASFCELPVITKVAHSAENLLDGLRHGTLRATASRVDLLCAVVDFVRVALASLSEGKGEHAYSSDAVTLTARIEFNLTDPALDYLPAKASLGAPEGANRRDAASGQAPVKAKSKPKKGRKSDAAEKSQGGDEALEAPRQAGVQASLEGKGEVPSAGNVISLEPTLDRSVSPGAAPSRRAVDAEPPEQELDLFELMPDLVEKFVAEAEEQIGSVEAMLLAIEQVGTNPQDIAEAFRHMHSFKGNCGIMALADLEEVTHALESQLSDWNAGANEPSREQITLMLSVLDLLRKAVATLSSERGRLENKEQILAALRAAREVKVDAPPRPATADDLKVPVEVDGLARPIPEVVGNVESPSPERASAAASIRVDTKKLDDLMNLVGELIIAETTVTHNPDLEGHEFENFQKAALNLNRITRLLQDVTMAVRMVPIESTFRKMVRLVRDVSHKQGKKVELTTSGEETEVDKSVVETIGDPLVHLIRNAIDHGLELPEVRESVGKARTGTLRLEAKHQGGEVWISISDDGRGIDPEKILARAIEKGIADSQRQYTRAEILDLIFAPGFSTADVLTDISGRGVGMDVVKRNIERVNGRVEIETEIGKGTSFSLRIPLTLAIIEGMLVRVGRSHYTIPLLTIRESVKATKTNVTVTSEGQQLLRLRDRHFPIVRLRDPAGDGVPTSIDQGILMLVESGSQVACILVDEVVGQRQTVIKPLPAYLRGTQNLSGCSILHNGDISLIVDVDTLIRAKNKREAA